MHEVESLIEYAKARNHLNADLLEPILAEDFTYESQWVFAAMHGKENYMEYIRGKFETFRYGDNIPVAELAYFPSTYGRQRVPCLILTQGDFKTGFLIETHNGKVTRADMVFITPPETSVLLGMAPR